MITHTDRDPQNCSTARPFALRPQMMIGGYRRDAIKFDELWAGDDDALARLYPILKARSEWGTSTPTLQTAPAALGIRTTIRMAVTEIRAGVSRVADCASSDVLPVSCRGGAVCRQHHFPALDDRGEMPDATLTLCVNGVHCEERIRQSNLGDQIEWRAAARRNALRSLSWAGLCVPGGFAMTAGWKRHGALGFLI